MKKYFSTFFAFFCFVFLVCVVGAETETQNSSASFYSRVLRCHIVANSDSHYDQNIKHKVRDGLEPLMRELFCDCNTVDEALSVANESKELFESTAKNVLCENNCNQQVKVIVGRENYTEKTYGGIVFPEGEYLSVRVVLGDGRGKNWWCVLFPMLNEIGVEEEGILFSSNGQGSTESKKENGGIEIFGCRIKLRILEFFE